MKLPRLVVLVVLVGGASACSLTATLIPVEGPLSTIRPVPVIQARVDGLMSMSGNVTFKLPDGDPCKGRWASTGGGGNVSFTSGSLISQYGSAYLSGYSVSSGSGQVPGQALVVCEKGNVFQVEFVTAGSAHGFGIAKDREENIYRFVF